MPFTYRFLQNKSTSLKRFLFSICSIAKTEFSTHIFQLILVQWENCFLDKSKVEPTIFFIENISFSFKFFSGHFYGQFFIKTVRGPWYPGSGVGLIVSIPDLCPLSYFHVFPLDNIRKPFTLCITQSLNNQIFFHLLYWIALFCIYWMNGKQFRCSVFTFVQYITNTGITDLNDIKLFSQPLHFINKLGQFMSILSTVILPRWKEPKICQNSI